MWLPLPGKAAKEVKDKAIVAGEKFMTEKNERGNENKRNEKK